MRGTRAGGGSAQRLGPHGDSGHSGKTQPASAAGAINQRADKLSKERRRAARKNAEKLK